MPGRLWRSVIVQRRFCHIIKSRDEVFWIKKINSQLKNMKLFIRSLVEITIDIEDFVILPPQDHRYV